MKHAKHTPGPWTTEADNAVISSNGQVICLDPGSDILNDGQIAKANARLISAAPDLLGFAKHVLAEQVAMGQDGDAQYIRLAEEVIAKATGGAE